MSPGERFAAERDERNMALVDEQVAKAKARAERKEHTPKVIMPEAGAMVATDPETGAVKRSMAVTPRHLMEQTKFDASVRRITPTAWVPDSRWPFRVRPVINNVDAWDAILEGYYCLRCLNRTETEYPLSQDACLHCKLTPEHRAKALDHILAMDVEDLHGAVGPDTSLDRAGLWTPPGAALVS